MMLLSLPSLKFPICEMGTPPQLLCLIPNGNTKRMKRRFQKGWSPERQARRYLKSKARKQGGGG